MKNELQRTFDKYFYKFSKNYFIGTSFEKITYSDFGKIVYNESAYLKMKNLEHSKIIVFLDRSVEQLAIEFSILYSGNVYLPIDISTPLDRVKYIIENSKADAIVASENMYNKLNCNLELIEAKEIYNYGLSNKNFYFQSEILDAADDAYVIYTSGTTGKPKGVRISQGNLLNLINSARGTIKFHDFYSTILMNSLSFDFSIWEVLIAFTNGGIIWIPDKDIRMDQIQLLDYIKEKSINHLAVTPSYLRALMHSVNLFGKDMKGTLKEVIAGAEKLSTSVCSEFFEIFGNDTVLYNAYGPTECTVCSFIMKITNKNLNGFKTESTMPIGVPYQDAEFKLVDENGVENKKHGKLLLSGMNVSSKGYIGLKEENKKKFSEINNVRYYDTGDIVDIKNGEVYFNSRIDSQVKIQGYRVELEEICNVLNQNEHIVDSHIILEEKNNKQELIAFIITDHNKTIDFKDLQKQCTRELPNYMIPNSFFTLSEFPRTLNEKIDEKRLMSLFYDSKEVNEEIYEGQENNSQNLNKRKKIFEEIVSNILKSENLELNKSFFAQGGHSLEAIILKSELKQKLNLDIHIKEILMSDSIEQLENSALGINENVLIKKASPFQKQMWIVQNLEANTAKYNIYFAFKPEKNIDPLRFENAVKSLHEASDVLRSSFIEKNNEVYASISKPSVPFVYNKEKTDITNLMKRLCKINDEEFELSNAPLYKIGLYELNDENQVIYFKFNHIILDEIGFENYLYNLTNIYKEPLKNLDLRKYYDYEWPSEESEEWEKKIINEAKCLEFKDTNYVLNKQAIRDWSIGSRKTSIILNKADEKKVSIFSVLLAAYCHSIFQLKRQKNFAVGVPMSTRDNVEKLNVIGPFLNTVPVLIENADQKTELIKSVFGSYCEALENANCSLYEIMSKVDHRDKGNDNPFFNIMFSEANSDYSSNVLGIKMEQLQFPIYTSKFPLALYYDIKDSEINLKLNYDGSRNTDEEIGNLISYFNEFIEEFIDEKEEKYNEKNAVIKKVWEDILENHSLKNDSNFFEAGGDSIKAIKVAIELKKLGIKNVNPRDIFKYPYLNEYAENILVSNRCNLIPRQNESLDIEKGHYNLSPVQEGMLWECINNLENKKLYHQQYVIKLNKKVSFQNFKEAVEWILKEYPSLTNKFEYKNGDEPFQKPSDIDETNISEYTEKYRNISDLDFDKKFILDKGSLIRFYLIHDKTENDLIMISYHHILLDGWSIAKVSDELLKLILKLETGNSIQVRNRDLDIEAKAIKVSRQVPTRDTIEYWEKQIPKLSNAMNTNRGMTKSASSFIVNRFISQEVYSKVKEVARKNGVSESVIFLAAYLMSSKAMGNVESKNVGITSSGRQNLTGAEIEAVTCLINTLPICIDFNEIELDNAIKIAKDKLNEINIYGDMSFNDLKKKINQKTNVNNDVYSDIFVFQNYPIRTSEFSKLGVKEVISNAGINYGSTFIANALSDGRMEIGMMCTEDKSKYFGSFLDEVIKVLIKFINHNKTQSPTRIEFMVSAAWSNVLKKENLGKKDDFFELGGDSISSMRISLKLKKAGLDAKPNLAFEYPTIEKMVNYLEKGVRNNAL